LLEAPISTLIRTLAQAACLVLLVGSIAACREEGPAEKAGKSLDKGVEKLKDAVDPPGPAEKAGRAVDKAVN
jgi:hypothetical protein